MDEIEIKKQRNREKSNMWYRENKEHHLLKSKRKYMEDADYRKEKIELAKRYYAENRESINKKRRERYANHRAHLEAIALGYVNEEHGISAVINENENKE